MTALRKDAGLCCGSRLRKGEVFAYVGLPQSLRDLKDVSMLVEPLSGELGTFQTSVLQSGLELKFKYLKPSPFIHPETGRPAAVCGLDEHIHAVEI